MRIVHLGLSAFFRAHQAWYTHRLNATPDGGAWGIAAFTGRRPDEAIRLQAQDGLYTLVTRSAAGDAFEVVSSISAAYPADDTAAWLRVFASDAVVLVTLTITEAGYCLAPNGTLDRVRADVAADIESLRADFRATVATAPAKLVQGLRARREVLGSGLAIVSCDNLASNGERTRDAVLALAGAVDAELRDWIAANVVFPGTMVDRITPRATEADRRLVLEGAGWIDESPVVTEPFSEWVIEQRFPGARPAWELVGARFVVDVQPYEQRKLLLLNGGHSLLAYLGLLRGHSTIAEAVADPVCRAALDDWWAECVPLLSFDAAEIDGYCASLLERWSNPRIRHQLAQIATDGSLKLRMRTAPVLRAHAASGSPSPAGELVFAAWLANIRGAGVPPRDADPTVAELAAPDVEVAIVRLLERFVPELAGDVELVQRISAAYQSCIVPSVSRLTGR